MSFLGSSKWLRQCKKRRRQISKTISGKKCQKWSEQKPHKHKYAFVGNHNFCRNPKNGHTSVWCYTTSRKKRWEICAVPKCKSGAAIGFENCDIGGSKFWLCYIGDPTTHGDLQCRNDFFTGQSSNRQCIGKADGTSCKKGCRAPDCRQVLWQE